MQGLDLHGIAGWNGKVRIFGPTLHFIFNNLSPLPLPSMANEFHEAVSHAYLPWMAQYLVKRAGIEPNLHSLYMAFIDYLEDMPLFELVLQETYSKIREILFADQPFPGPSLKNLGHWLGLQTLARDKGVSEEWLPLKEVILFAAHGDLSNLLCVLSFVSQLLGHSAHSRIFQPSHPWIVDILFLLGQLYVYASFSSNLRLCLAIEIIFTHLSIDISDFYRARVPAIKYLMNSSKLG